MTSYEQVSLIISLLSFITLVIGLVIAIIQIYQLRKQRLAEHDWNRRANSFSYSFGDDPSILNVITKLDCYLEVSSKKSYEINFNKIEKLRKSEYPEILNDIYFVLVRLANMCTAIKHSVADEEVCRDMLGERTIDFFRYFRHFIETIRDSRGSQHLFSNLEFFANKWGEKHHFEKRSSTDA